MTSPFPHDHHAQQGRHAARGRTVTPIGGAPVGGRRLRAASAPAPPRDEHRCHRCGRGPAHPLEAINMTAQWLVAGPDGPQLRRFCPGCRPAGPVSDLTCARCGDGPLLVGDLATDQTGRLPEPTRAWLADAGWRLPAATAPTCPQCHHG